jgi:hypothetical protein
VLKASTKHATTTKRLIFASFAAEVTGFYTLRDENTSHAVGQRVTAEGREAARGTSSTVAEARSKTATRRGALPARRRSPRLSHELAEDGDLQPPSTAQ